jgi:benzaldehyde dehydrogenase (NAD)
VITHEGAAAAAVVEAAVAHPAVRRVNFTGSTRVGRMIAELCGRHLKPVLLELGGKAPLVVLDDADLDAAVGAAAFGAFMHQGQICMSTERIVVDQKVGDGFVAKLRAKTETLKVGDPAQGQFQLGSVVDLSTVERVNALLDDAVSKGARIVTGGKATSTLMPATIVDGVKPGMRIYAEESFGPVVAVIRTNGVEEAVRSANDTEYGLSAAVFGGDVGRALAVAQQIDSGICHVNGPTVQDEGQMPFGGVKGSGYGRFGGKAGIDEFTDLRWITVQQAPRHYPI